jgi:hypothetical protein
LLSLPGAQLIDLPHGDELLSFDRLHAQAVADGGPANGGAVPSSTLPTDVMTPVSKRMRSVRLVLPAST